MAKFDGEFEQFFGDPIVKKLIAKDPSGTNYLFSLKEDEERLWDTTRFRAFRDAIHQNTHLFKDKVVLAFRSGLGLLAIWAARAGAARVICLEDSPTIDFIRAQVQAEGLDCVDCIRADASQFSLAVGMVDVIIADWMGYFCTNQRFVYDLIYLRDRCLKPEGIILPDKATFWASCFSDAEQYREKFSFWDDVYGFSMPSMKSVCFGEAVFERLEPRYLVSTVRSLRTVDIRRVGADELEFVSRITVDLKRRPAVIHGVAIWFDVSFSQCHEPIFIRTSPFKNKTDICNVKLFFSRPVEAAGEGSIELMVVLQNLSEDVSKTRVKVGFAMKSPKMSFCQYYLMK